MIVIVYLLLCVLVGVTGRRRRPGFLGYFLLSIPLTPVVTLMFLLATQRRFLERESLITSHMATCQHCRHQQRQAAAVAYCTHCGRPL